MADAVIYDNNPAYGEPKSLVFNEGLAAKILLACMVFAVVFINAADFRGATGEKFSVHWQIYLRLMVCGISGLVGLLFFHHSFLAFLRMPGLLFAFQILWIGITLAFSINKSYSVAAFISLGCIALMTPAALRILGPSNFLLSVVAGLVTYLLGSWVAYLFFPEIGVFQEQITETEVFERMGGLGHPNELGFYCALTVVLTAGLRYCGVVGTAIAVPVGLLGIGTLGACYSRTSLLLTVIGLTVVYRREIFTERTVLFGMLMMLTLIPIVGFYYATGDLDWFFQDLAKKVSKSGSSDELSTATGRTEIWAYAIDQISEKPLRGFGYATQRFVMDEHSYHCHNVFLNYCMSAGLLGGLLFAAMALNLFYSTWLKPRPEIDGIIIMILVGGMVEGLLIAPSPTASMLIFLAAVFWRQLGFNLSETTARR